MFSPTNNPYQFKYLITGITGQGIPQVYLPEIPNENKIFFKKENKFIRHEIDPKVKKWSDEQRLAKEYDPDYVHQHADKILEWENFHWKLTEEGMFFWNKGVITYLTPFYIWYLTSIKTYFGRPAYRETDKEIAYLLDYCCEDPACFGALINTIRRYGKSSILGAWILYRATHNWNHTCGMQGQKLSKIKNFFAKMVVKPFLKLPYYLQPKFDTTSTHKEELRFDDLPERAKKRKLKLDQETLESVIDYRASGTDEYDGEELFSFLIEEPGKITESSIYSDEGDGIWDVIKPCLLDGTLIRGKAFGGTTVEYLNIADKGGQAYKNLYYDSDFDKKQPNGQTVSGLYTAFVPGDCALKGFIDEWGHPMREQARAKIIMDRESYRNNPTKLAGYIRRYPLSIVEIFYVNPDSCRFDSQVLQDRLREIDTSLVPYTSPIDLYWENGVRFSKVLWRANPQAGWFQMAAGWPEIDEANKVERMHIGGGQYAYRPLNDDKFAIGFDPIQHRNAAGVKKTNRQSRPVALCKRKYDSSIDGVMDDELMKKRREERYRYGSNIYIGMMQVRPNDPNVLFERLLLVCWYLGCSAHIEKQKDAVISYFHDKGCGDFVMSKYVHDYEGPQALTDGTASTPRLIEDYTNEYDHYITNYGHTIPFREQVEDALIFNPSETTIHDHTVAAGFCELACKMRPKYEKPKFFDLGDMMTVYDRAGNPIN